MINESYRQKGYSKELLENAFTYLGTEQPLITIPEKRLDEFSKIITAYHWQESTRIDQYFSEKVIFNQPKQLIKKK